MSKRTSPRDKALKLAARAKNNANVHERDAACLALGKLVADHDLLKQEPMVARAADSARSTVEELRKAANDPKVKETAESIANAARAATDLFNVLRRGRT